MKLTDRFDGDSIEINGKEFQINFSYDNILRIYELQEDDKFSDRTKIDLMFEMLFVDCDVSLKIDQKSQLIEYVFDKLLDKEEVTERNQESQNDGEHQNETHKPKVFDMTIDAERIYASFMYDYKIDLFEEQGKLHWNKFTALLNGLSEATPFMRVIKIRTMEVPAPNEYNTEERLEIIKLKRMYELEDPTSNVGVVLDQLAEIFKNRAKKRGENKR